jgi:hypothetical protein
MKTSEMIAKYITLRDKKSELEAAHKESVKRINEVMKKIESMIMAQFNETGEESAKTAAGTAYKTTQTSAKVADRDAFLDFVRASEAWGFIENRVNKTAVEEYLAEHEELPPGVDVNRAYTINIRRS